MMSIQEKSKENSSSVIKKNEDKNLETQVQGSQKNLAKKSDPKEAIKSLVKSPNESKVNQPELGACMSTRSASTDKRASKSTNKNMVTVKGHSQQESTKQKKISQKKTFFSGERGELKPSLFWRRRWRNICIFQKGNPKGGKRKRKGVI